MNKKITVYFLIPDLFRRRLNLKGLVFAIKRGKLDRFLRNNWFARHKPVGGIKVFYQHCLILRELGYDAQLVKYGEYSGNFFHYPIKCLDYSNISLSEPQVVISPEIAPYLALEFNSAIKLMFVQNWNNIYDRSYRREDYGKGFKELGFDSILTCSRFLVSKIGRDDPDAIAVVDNYINLKKFVPDSKLRRPGKVIGFPRKNKQDLDSIAARVAEHGITIEYVDGLSEDEVIREYQSADIFVAVGYPEGFGLPPLEAMACGAVVVGFTGGGASEFMKHEETALVAKDGDTLSASRMLIELYSDSERKERLRNSGLAMSRKYGESRTRQQLESYFKRIIEQHQNKELVGASEDNHMKNQ